MRVYLEYIGAKILIYLVKVLPKSFIYKIAEIVVNRSYGRGSKREGRIKRHLNFAFDDKKRVEKIYKEYLLHKSSLFAEIVLMIAGRFDYEKAVVNLKEAKAKIEHLKSINQNGMVFLVSHYGNWEFLAQFFAINGLPGTLVAKEHRKNPLIDERIIQTYRSGFGHRVIKREGALRAIAKILKNKEGVGMHIDQMIPPPNGVEVEFFGQKVFASKSMAQLKLKFNPLMVPIFAKRVDKEKFEIIIKEPVEYQALEVKNLNEKIKKITQKYTNILEQEILSSPAQWAWEYKRWRKPNKE